MLTKLQRAVFVAHAVNVTTAISKLRKMVTTLSEVADEIAVEADCLGETELDTLASNVLDTAVLFDEEVMGSEKMGMGLAEFADLCKTIRALPTSD